MAYISNRNSKDYQRSLQGGTDHEIENSLSFPPDAVVPVVSEPISDSPVRTVGMEEANTFLAVKELNSRRIALGVLLCILSPIVLIVLGGAQDLGLVPITDMQAGGIGLVTLMLLVGCAVALFVTSGLRTSPFEYLEKEPIDTLYGVDGMVRGRRDRFRSTFNRQLTLGIVLCVVGVLPLFIAMIFCKEDSFALVASMLPDSNSPSPL